MVLSDEPAQGLMNQSMIEAQSAVQDAAKDPGLVEQVWRQAEQVLQGAFEVMGWEVELRWVSTKQLA